MRDEEIFSRDLDWNLLKMFNQIVQSGGVSAAARQMLRNQPAVSLALKRFEDRIGTTLCRRGPGGFELLDDGELVADTCRQLAQLVETLPLKLSDISKSIKGVVRIRAVTDVVCVELDETLHRFREKYPEVQIDLNIGPEESIVRAVQRNEVEIGVATNRIKIADLEYELLFREVHQAFCGRAFHLFGQKIENLASYADELYLLGGVDEPDELKKFRAETGIGHNTAGRSENIAELRRLAILGLGICFLPDRCAEPDIAAGRLWPLTPDCDDWGIDIYLITNPEAPRQQLQRLFVEEVRSVKAEIAET
jgi:DNA-binding transcriptional LysR family regulator